MLQKILNFSFQRPPQQQVTIPNDEALFAKVQADYEALTKSADPMMDLDPGNVRATFGPGNPIRPLAKPWNEDIPREIDYPPSVNSTLSPRTNYGLMSFLTLNQLYQGVPEAKRPVNLLARELCAMIPQLVDAEGKPVIGHPFSWITESPDRSSPWVVWVTRFIRSLKAFDAPAAHISTDSNGYWTGLDYIDGSTLFLLVDQYGRTPRAPQPAYAQIIKGTPFTWWTDEEVWYRPAFKRHNAPYGESFLEEELTWLLILANLQGFELAHYREGNMPEGYATAPEKWKLPQIDWFETMFNARMSVGPAERRRWRFLPNGFKFEQLKAAEFPAQLYELARDNVSIAAGVPPGEYGKMPGQGLGGKGLASEQSTSLFRMGINPVRSAIIAPFNEMLARSGVNDVRLKIITSPDQIDPDKQRKSVLDQFTNGLITLNQARTVLGMGPVTGGDIFMVIRGGQVVVLNQFMQQAMEGGQAAGQPENASGLLDAFADDQDKQAAVKVLSTGNITKGTFTSVPTQPFSVGSTEEIDDEDLLPPEDAEEIIVALGADPEEVDLGQFAQGFAEEQEHADTVDDDQMVVAQIVLDHLEEDPEYYTHLEKAGKTAHDPKTGQFTSGAGGGGGGGGAKPGTARAAGPTAGMNAAEAAGYRRAQLKAQAAAERHKGKGKPKGKAPAKPKGKGAGKAPAAPPVSGGGKFKMSPAQKMGDGSRQRTFTMNAQPGSISYNKNAQGGIELKGLNVPKDATVGDKAAVIAEAFKFAQGTSLKSTGNAALDEALLRHGVKVDNPAQAAPKAPKAAPTPATHVAQTAPDQAATQRAKERFVHKGDMLDSTDPIHIEKAWGYDFAKHCGVCEDDDLYYGAPISREMKIPWPGNAHANEVEIVAMVPSGLSPRPAVFKPEGGEIDALQDMVGGPQYVRTEAAYILDRSLGFYLVPVSYISEVDGEYGSVQHYVRDRQAALTPESYDPRWLEYAAISDYISGEMDRNTGNWLTHPDDPTRPILIDNGLTFPSTPTISGSPFVTEWKGKEVSEPCLAAVARCLTDAVAWHDIKRLVGEDAANLAMERAKQIMATHTIPEQSPNVAPSDSPRLMTGNPVDGRPDVPDTDITGGEGG